MNYLFEVAIIGLAALVHATLQLGIGSLLLLYHASLGKHIKKRTKSLVRSFIRGSGLIILLVLAAACYVVAVATGEDLTAEALTMVAGILVALAICVWFFYYRHGDTTELWLPKTVARLITRRAKVTESNTEAFALGMLASIAEMPLALALIVVAANSILALPSLYQIVAVVAYAAVAVAPLVVLRLAIRHGKTVVDVQKWRVKNKTFFRLLSGISFLVLALFLVAFKVLGGW